MTSPCALAIGFAIDFFVGDPEGFPHPVRLMGRAVSLLEKPLRRAFPETSKGERTAGALMWIIVASLSLLIPALILALCQRIGAPLRLAAESLMCWQALAARSLKDESLEVAKALESGDLKAARKDVSMIVGRDTEKLDEAGVARAAVETVAENTSDGVIAPLFFAAIGGAPLAMMYKAVNTMDSMVGYIDPPYTDFGRVPAKADDAFNYIPARVSALLMIAAGALLGFDAKNGLRIFRRDRYKHASPNSAQTEAACAGLLGLQLAGDASYGGVLHKKEHIGDPLRPIEAKDIERSCRIMYLASFLALLLFSAARLAALNIAGF
ncbi:MAG: cobalamin biosynthesis protein CobD [Firmicutes bacterium]|nr:cobalamin biosynthesis protein CobD [Bacillota bacterium]